MPPEKIFVSWDEVVTNAKKLACRIIESGKLYKGIVVISTGGLVGAAMIAKLLNIKLMDIVSITSYDKQEHGHTKSVINILSYPELSMKDKGENWLIFDDLIDSGDTYDHTISILPKADFACLYNKAAHNNITDDRIIYATKCDNSWLVFPWELDEISD